MRRAPRPYRQLARPSVELQVTRRDAALDDVLAVLGCRGDREDERRGVTWVLREDPAPGEPLSAATRRVLDRLVPLRSALVELARRGFALRLLLQQAPGEGHVVPAGVFAEAAAWGGRLDVDQFVVVDCGDLDPAAPGIFLDPAAVAAQAATGTDLLVGGYGTPEPLTDPGWVLPWRGRVVREVRFADGWLHVRLDDRSELDAHVGPEGLDVADLTEVGPRRRPDRDVLGLHVVRSALLWPDGLRLTGDGMRVQGRVSELSVRGRGFRFSEGALEFSQAPAVLEGWAERDGLTLLWHPSSTTGPPGFPVGSAPEPDLTDVHLATAGTLDPTRVLLDALRANGSTVSPWPSPGPSPGHSPSASSESGADAPVVLAEQDPTAFLRSRAGSQVGMQVGTWGGWPAGVVGVLTPADEVARAAGGIRFTAPSELVAQLLDRLRG